ncbi:MAG: ABC transporter permease [Chitinophagales bacterium]
MFTNYIKTAYRNLIRNKGYAFINILGLTLGIACCLLIFLVVKHETSFDLFHTKADRIYRVVTERLSRDDGNFNGYTQYPAAKAIRTDFSEIEMVTQIHNHQETSLSIEGELFKVDNSIFADPYFFEVFNYKWIEGSPSTALDEPNSIVLTRTLAKKFFPLEASVLGKVVTFNQTVDLKVTGLLEDTPQNSSLAFDIAISFSNLKEFAAGGNDIDSWTWTWAGSTYIVLPENVSPESIDSQFDAFEKKYLSERSAADRNYFLQPLTAMHFDTRFEGSTDRASINKTYLWIFGLIGLFLVLIACINFINIATAQAVKRSREVGVRKVLGANRKQLVKQFLGETFFITTIAVLFALTLAELLLPYLNAFLEQNLQLNIFSPTILLFSFSSIVITSLLAGFYPAMVLSGYQAAVALRNTLTTNKKSSLLMRRGLVVFQFIISQVLIVGTLVMTYQMNYVKNKDLGFDQEAIVMLDLPDDTPETLNRLKTELLQHPSIENVSYAMGAPIAWSSWTSNIEIGDKGKEGDKIYSEIKPVDVNFLDTYGLQLAAGEWYPPQAAKDSIYEKGVVINEQLVKKMGYDSNESILGEKLFFNGWEMPIIGVLQSFHNRSLQMDIIPAVFFRGDIFTATAGVKMNTQNPQKTLAYIENTYTNVFPNRLFEYQFLDERLGDAYEEEAKLQQLFRMFALMAIFIACLGLVGLVSFMAAQKTKEIGVRKVLGASVGNIVLLFSKEFTKLVVIAFFIATPLAYYAMSQWLQNFAYSIDIGISIFLIAIAFSLVVAWLSVGYQAVSAALANPVKALRAE